MEMTWNTDPRPPEHGYYIAAWDDEGHWRVSELWFNPDSTGSGWWPTRGYMARFVGDAATNLPRKSLTVIAWMPKPEYPGEGNIAGYRVFGNDQIIAPSSVAIVREEKP